MSYYVKTAAGLVLLLGGIIAAGYCVLRLASFGTCASGGPYVSARQCPSGTGALSWSIAPALLVAIAGGGLFAARGRRATPPGLPPKTV